jgi:ABC-type uncharacterized transport system substrate-binding protein
LNKLARLIDNILNRAKTTSFHCDDRTATPDGGFTVTNRAASQKAVDRHRLPSITPWRQFVSGGALMSYGSDSIDIFRRSANYVDRILKGERDLRSGNQTQTLLGR